MFLIVIYYWLVKFLFSVSIFDFGISSVSSIEFFISISFKSGIKVLLDNESNDFVLVIDGFKSIKSKLDSVKLLLFINKLFNNSVSNDGA